MTRIWFNGCRLECQAGLPEGHLSLGPASGLLFLHFKRAGVDLQLWGGYQRRGPALAGLHEPALCPAPPVTRDDVARDDLLACVVWVVSRARPPSPSHLAPGVVLSPSVLALCRQHLQVEWASLEHRL